MTPASKRKTPCRTGAAPLARARGDGRMLDPGGDPISVVTLGCPKNLVDSEIMLGTLHRSGFRIAEHVEEAVLVVVNTCAFLTASQQESIEAILEVARLKEHGRLRKLVVAGCLPQRHGGSVLEELPEVDYLLGPGTVGDVVEVARGLLDGTLERGERLDGLDRIEIDWEPRVLSGHRHTAYLKISEGCSHTCAFCIIPQLRGRHRSRPLEELEAEARRLAESGVRELTLIAQDTTSWGADLYGRPALDRLLERIDRIEGLRWVRLLYTYPHAWTDGLVDCFGRLERLVPYADIPIQHAADSVLVRMGRGASWRRTTRLLERLRAVPDMALRTTVITGFPGETEEEFELLLRALADFEFDHLGAFAYSTEGGTAAASLPGALPEEIRNERRDRVLAAQRTVALRRNRAHIGAVLDVLVDTVDPANGLIRGRWKGQALEIDGLVAATASPVAEGREAVLPEPGAFVPVRIKGAGPYDLVGSIAETPASERRQSEDSGSDR